MWRSGQTFHRTKKFRNHGHWSEDSYCSGKWMNLFVSRHDVHSTKTHSAQRRSIKIDKQNVLQRHCIWLNLRVKDTFSTERFQCFAQKYSWLHFVEIKSKPIFRFSAIILSPEMVESQSRALKAPWTSLILAPDMAESQSRALKALWNLDYRNDSLIPENICHPQRNPNLKRIFFFLIWTLGLAESIDVLKTSGSFHVQSPNGLNPTLSEFNEIWHTCWFRPQTSNLKFFIDQMIGFRDMRGLIFWKFRENKGGAQLKNSISFELVVQSGKARYLWKKEKARNSNLTLFLWFG